MALAVQGAVLCLIDIRGDDAVEVAPADDEAHCDAAFVHAFGVVGGPDDDVGDAGVNAQGGEKGAGVADSGGGSVGRLVVSLIILVGSFRVGSDLRVDGGERTRLRASRSRPCRAKMCRCCRGLAGVFDRQYLWAVSRCRLHRCTIRFILTADSNRQDGGSCVGRDGQELCSCRCVAKR